MLALASFGSAGRRRPQRGSNVAEPGSTKPRTRRGFGKRLKSFELPVHPKVKVTGEQMEAVNLRGEEFHPEWNYTITVTNFRRAF